MEAVGLFFVLLLGGAGVLVIAYAVTFGPRGRHVTHRHEQPAWSRYRVRFCIFALILIAFDMEMAYMQPLPAPDPPAVLGPRPPGLPCPSRTARLAHHSGPHSPSPASRWSHSGLQPSRCSRWPRSQL